MNVQLIHGHFAPQDAIDIITRIIDVKITFHESKIQNHSSEEDITMREKRIHELQNSLAAIREQIKNAPASVNLEAVLQLN